MRNRRERCASALDTDAYFLIRRPHPTITLETEYEVISLQCHGRSQTHDMLARLELFVPPPAHSAQTLIRSFCVIPHNIAPPALSSISDSESDMEVEPSPAPSREPDDNGLTVVVGRKRARNAPRLNLNLSLAPYPDIFLAERKINTEQDIRINVQTVDDYRKLTKYLNQTQRQFPYVQHPERAGFRGSESRH